MLLYVILCKCYVIVNLYAEVTNKVIWVLKSIADIQKTSKRNLQIIPQNFKII